MKTYHPSRSPFQVSLMLFRMCLHGGIMFTRFLFFISEWVIVSVGISILRIFDKSVRYSNHIRLLPNQSAPASRELRSN